VGNFPRQGAHRHQGPATAVDKAAQSIEQGGSAPGEGAPATRRRPDAVLVLCLKPSTAVKLLIAGSGLACICDGCVDECVKIVADQRAKAGPDHVPDDPPPNATAQNPAEAAPEPEAEGASPGLVKLLDTHHETPTADRGALRDWVMRAAVLGGPCPDAVAGFNEVWRVASMADQKAFRKFLLGRR
jgi:hypothetical protein